MSVESPNDNEGLLRTLHLAGVDFILIGGMAAIVHGAARLTFDLDIVYKRSRHNHERLVAALSNFGPYLRGAPPGLPFRWDVETIERGDEEFPCPEPESPAALPRRAIPTTT